MKTQKKLRLKLSFFTFKAHLKSSLKRYLRIMKYVEIIFFVEKHVFYQKCVCPTIFHENFVFCLTPLECLISMC